MLLQLLSAGAAPAAPACPQGAVFLAEAGGCVRPPVPIATVEAERPGHCAAGSPCRASILAVVRKDGTVGDVLMASSEPSGELEPVVATIRRWKFAPGTDAEGRPVGMYVTIRLQWEPEP